MNNGESVPAGKRTVEHKVRPFKWVLLALTVAAAGMIYWQFGNQLTLAGLAQHEAEVQNFQLHHPLLVYALAFVGYVIVAGLALPGAAGLTLLYGWFFGMWRTFVLVSFASTVGATLAFLLSRYVLGTTMQARFPERLAGFNESLKREGPFFLFTLRLIPLVPFFIINIVMGLTPIKTSTFWWVSQLGMIPGTLAYAYAGSSVPNLQALAEKGVRTAFTAEQWLKMTIAFGLLGLLPFLLRFLLHLIRRALHKTNLEVPTRDIPQNNR
jgi:uncharacterized membrane protein YdjX (TVP38/TMEM64 family)